MDVKKITAVLLVDEVEPCVSFWVDRLGFTTTSVVPDGDRLAFAMLQKDGVEVMYQTYASVGKDDPNAEAVKKKGPTFLYVEVDDLDGVMAATKGAEVTMPERTTFYGAREFGIRDPGGHSLTFAQFSH